MTLTQCMSCGKNKGFTPDNERYSRTEWLRCNACGYLHFRVGSGFGY